MKQLALKSSQKKISGLCAGIADYFDVDVTIVRLAMLAMTLITGVVPGAVFYFVASLVTPKENHHA
jgi:phage shock protein PspC (stress-responsive transcriptional regulator)